MIRFDSILGVFRLFLYMFRLFVIVVGGMIIVDHLL